MKSQNKSFEFEDVLILKLPNLNMNFIILFYFTKFLEYNIWVVLTDILKRLTNIQKWLTVYTYIKINIKIKSDKIYQFFSIRLSGIQKY